MSNWLDRLASRAWAAVEDVTPRLPSRFEATATAFGRLSTGPAVVPFVSGREPAPDSPPLLPRPAEPPPRGATPSDSGLVARADVLEHRTANPVPLFAPVAVRAPEAVVPNVVAPASAPLTTTPRRLTTPNADSARGTAAASAPPRPPVPENSREPSLRIRPESRVAGPTAIHAPEQPQRDLHLRVEPVLPNTARTIVPRSAPTVQVTIGRVEVRAVPPPHRTAPRARARAMSLDEYLRRAGGDSR